MLEVLLWGLGALLGLVAVVVLGLQIPAVQQAAARKLTAYMAARAQTRISIGRFTTDWRNSLVLKDIYLEDQHRDTLFYAGRLGLDLNFLALKRQQVKLRSVRVENGVWRVHSRPNDSLFNYQFLLAAFKGRKTAKAGHLRFELKNLHLSGIRVTVNDSAKGNFTRAFIGELSAKFEGLGSEFRTPGLGEISLKNSTFQIRKTKLPGASASPAFPVFTLNRLDLEGVGFRFEDAPVGRVISGKIGNAHLQAEKVLLAEKRTDLKKLLVSEAHLVVLQKKISRADSALLASQDSVLKTNSKPAGGWSIWLKQATLENVRYTFNDQYFPEDKGLDLKHLAVREMNLTLENIYFSRNSVTARLQELQLQEKSGLKILGARGEAKIIPGSVALQKLELHTASGFLKGSLEVLLPTRQRAALKAQPVVKATLEKVKISPREVLLLAPAVAGNAGFRKLGDRPVVASGNFTRTGNGLFFKNLRAQLLTGTHLAFDGQVTGRSKSQVMDLQIRHLQTNRNDLLALRGKSASKMRFPAQVNLSGRVRRSAETLGFQGLKVTASNGTTLQMNGTVSTGKTKTYLDLHVQDLQTSRPALLEMLPPGAVTPEVQLPDKIRFRGQFKGTSLQEFVLSNGVFETTLGRVQTDLKMVPVQRFSGNLSLEEFELGKLLKQEKTLGNVTGKADFRGSGFKVKTMELHYNARVKSFEYKGDTYRNLRLEGNLNQKIYQLNGNLANAALQGLGHKLKKIKPKNLDLRKADPTRLLPKKIEPKKVIPGFLRKKKDKKETK